MKNGRPSLLSKGGNNMLLELKDGGIEKFNTESDYQKGYCDTCEFGSLYLRYFSIETTKYEMQVKASAEYYTPLSEGYLMKIMLNNVDVIKNMTESEFIEWINEEFEKEIKEKESNTEMEIKIIEK